MIALPKQNSPEKSVEVISAIAQITTPTEEKPFVYTTAKVNTEYQTQIF